MQIKKIKRNKKKSLLILGSFLIILSISLLLVKYINIYKNDNKEKKAIEDFYIQEEVINSEEQHDNNLVNKESSNYDYIAVLRIPRINLKKGLVSKSSRYNNIEYNVTIHELSSRPDEINGNVILMAHSGTAYISYFNNLRSLKINDHIYLDYHNKTYDYRITNIYDVEKTGSLNIKRNNNTSTITLITCRDNTNKQIVVIGEIEFVN